LSGRGLCDGLITHPEESYRLWCVLLCDLENEEAKTHKWVVKASKIIIIIGKIVLLPSSSSSSSSSLWLAVGP
jgi:hypothetical protein